MLSRAVDAGCGASARGEPRTPSHCRHEIREDKLVGSEAEREIAEDFRLLEAAEPGTAPLFRAWSCSRPTVVLGRALDAQREVDIEYCTARDIPIVRRQSGGGAVLIGPGTLQYAFVLRYSLSAELRDIASSKRFCNRLLLAALGVRPGLGEDASGDLTLDGRKVAGLALRRRRQAMLLHGSILVRADLEEIDRVLAHPSREPSYRDGRTHGDFLANLGSLDPARMTSRVTESLGKIGQ